MKFHQKLNEQAMALKSVAEMFGTLAALLPPEASTEAATYHNAAGLVTNAATAVMRLASEAIASE